MGNCNGRICNGGGATLPKVARILIADDHALVREALTSMLPGEDGSPSLVSTPPMAACQPVGQGFRVHKLKC